MIRGIGIDIADIGRFRNAGDMPALLGEFLTPREIGRMTGRGPDPAYVALMFSAKEALLKALGCGLAEGWRWQEIEISEDLRVELSGRLGQIAAERAVARILVSHALFMDHAVALVLLDG